MSIYKNRGLPITRVLPKEDQAAYNEEPVLVSTPEEIVVESKSLKEAKTTEKKTSL